MPKDQTEETRGLVEIEPKSGHKKFFLIVSWSAFRKILWQLKIVVFLRVHQNT